MEKQTALITGASRGIGRAIALRLADAGYNVAINYHGNQEKAEAVRRECEEKGVKAILCQCNVADHDAVKIMVEQVMASFGRIDVLVNNAGITEDGLLLRMSEEAFDRVIDVNLKGCFNCTQAVSAVMLRQKYGRIINMASVVGLSGNAGQANYAASKAGVIALTKTVAKELASRGITANAIAPGFIESDMSGALSEKTQKTILSQIPMKRFGKPEDVAKLACFLAGEDSAYITGQVLSIDGGMSV